MTAVLFLDVDGVLNHRAIFLPSRHKPALCPDCIARLRRLVERTGCRVVLSSTWRLLDHHTAELRAAGGFPGEHEDWRTEQLPATVFKGRSAGVSTLLLPGVNIPKRGDEIAEWLSRHPEVTRYAIVDDEDDTRGRALPEHYDAHEKGRKAGG